jgi:hypothetical protein
LIERLVEILGKIPQGASVGFYGTLSVIATLEFLQHHSSEMGHKDFLVTQNIVTVQPIAAPVTTRSVRRSQRPSSNGVVGG